jgi:hypothetical protein
MIEQMEKDVFYSTLCNLLRFKYLTILATQQWSCITSSDVITGVMRDKDRDVAAAGQPGDRLCKQTLFTAALDCTVAFFFSLHNSNFDISRSRVWGSASSSLQLVFAQILIQSPK